MRLSPGLGGVTLTLLALPLCAAPCDAQGRATPLSGPTAHPTSAADRNADDAVDGARRLAILPLATGMLLYFDPDRGTIVERPTPAQRAALHRAIRADRARRAALLHESSRGLRSFAIPGGVGIALEGRYTHALVLRLRPDGSAEIECSDDLPTKQELESRAPAIGNVEKQ